MVYACILAIACKNIFSIPLSPLRENMQNHILITHHLHNRRSLDYTHRTLYANKIITLGNEYPRTNSVVVYPLCDIQKKYITFLSFQNTPIKTRFTLTANLLTFVL